MTTIEYIRSFRLVDYAIFDLVISFLGMFLISPLLSKIFLKFNIIIPKKNWLFLTLPISIVIHLLTGNITLMTKNFFNLQGDYLLKILIISLTIYGFKGIKILKK